MTFFSWLSDEADIGRNNAICIAGIPPGKLDASGGIGPKNLMLKWRCVSARCRPMRPIFPVEFQFIWAFLKHPFKGMGTIPPTTLMSHVKKSTV